MFYRGREVHGVSDGCHLSANFPLGRTHISEVLSLSSEQLQFGIRLSANEGDEGFQRLQFVSFL